MLEYWIAFFVGCSFALFSGAGVYHLFFPGMNRLQRVLGLMLVLFALFLVKDMVYLYPGVRENIVLYRGLLILDNWAVVFGNLFALEILRPGYVRLSAFLRHLSGFLVFLLWYCVDGEMYVYRLNWVFTIVYCAVSLSYLGYRTSRYRKLVREMYSDLAYLDVQWLWLAIVLLLVNFSIWSLVYFEETSWTDLLYYMLMLLTWGYFVWRVARQQPVDPDVLEEISSGPAAEVPAGVPPVEEAGVPESAESTRGSGLEVLPGRGGESEHCADQCAEHFAIHFAESLEVLRQNGYFSRHPQLTLSELAAELHTNRSTLSYYINHHLNATFYDLINGIRLEYAEQLLSASASASADRLTLEDVACRSGFNSVSTFRRAFQKKYGQSPAKFRKNV